MLVLLGCHHTNLQPSTLEDEVNVILRWKHLVNGYDAVQKNRQARENDTRIKQDNNTEQN
jgi:hypothetical protein